MEHFGAPLFSWLHLSDIHFGHGRGTEREHRNLVLNTFLSQLGKTEHWRTPKPDAVFVTGDIGFSGDGLGRNEYLQATEWLRRLACQLGLTPRDIYLVPGNHDVIRVQEKDNPEVFRLVAELRSGQQGRRTIDDALDDISARSLLARRMRYYLDFAAQFGPGNGEVISQDGLFWYRRLSGRGNLRVRIAGLNTALLANDDADRCSLQLGYRQLNHVFSELDERELIIVLSHHPLDWLRDGPQVDGWLQARADILLSGHIHSQNSLLTQQGGGSPVCLCCCWCPPRSKCCS